MIFKKLLLTNNKSVSVHSAFNGNTEESVVPDIVVAGTGGRSTGRAATGENNSDNNSSKNDSKLFHDFISFINRRSLTGTLLQIPSLGII